MKLLPIAAALSCAALLAGCGRQSAGTSDIETQAQERLADEQQAAQLSDLHEREAALDERERLLDERAQQLAAPSIPPAQASPNPTPAQPQPAPVNTEASYQVFYDLLSPYGTWYQMPGYVWQPAATVQDSRWRPYTLGHWAYTNNGWTWVSSEPFGWITYHYGRWMRTRTLGWVWTPGDQWAPAWVSWRYGNNFVGWAPLPPEARFDGAAGIQQWADGQYDLSSSDYTFVPASEFGDDSMAGVQVPPEQNGPIFDDSENVTDIYYDNGAYAIICYGPNYDFMRFKSRRSLPPPFILSRAGFRAGGANGATISGHTLEVAAPRIVPDRIPAAPRTIRGRVADGRLVTPSAARGSATVPLYQPNETVSGQPASGMSVPSQANPAVTPQPGVGIAATDRAAPTGTGIPSERNSTPVSPDAAAQTAHDLQIIQQQQAAEELVRQQSEAMRAAQEQRAEELHVQEVAAAQRAAADASARAAHEQEVAAREQAAAHPAPQPAQPIGAPAGTQPPLRGQP
jgi:hypothetical protein